MDATREMRVPIYFPDDDTAGHVQSSLFYRFKIPPLSFTKSLCVFRDGSGLSGLQDHILLVIII